MKYLSCVSAVVIGCLTMTQGQAQSAAQSQQQPAVKPLVAVVDMGYILKNHPTMKSEMESIEAQMAAADQEMNDRKNAIVKQVDQLREQYTEGTPEYDRAEKAIAEQDANFRLEISKKRKQFETAQADVLFRAYNNINNYLKYYADQTGTQLIVRVTREKMDPKKPETIQLVMGQDTLYYRPDTDITNWLLDALKSQSKQTASAAGSGVRQ